MKAEFYRYEWIEYASLDNDEGYINSRLVNPKVVLRTYVLVKETPRGYWIAPEGLPHYNKMHKWIPKQSKKRYAYPTKAEAIRNFTARTLRRIRILSRTLDCCKAALSIGESMQVQIATP